MLLHRLWPGIIIIISLGGGHTESSRWYHPPVTGVEVSATEGEPYKYQPHSYNYTFSSCKQALLDLFSHFWSLDFVFFCQFPAIQYDYDLISFKCFFLLKSILCENLDNF